MNKEQRTAIKQALHSSKLDHQQKDAIKSANHNRIWAFYIGNAALGVGLFMMIRRKLLSRPVVANSILAAMLFSGLIGMEYGTRKLMWDEIK
jgi:hypothetical protein